MGVRGLRVVWGGEGLANGEWLGGGAVNETRVRLCMVGSQGGFVGWGAGGGPMQKGTCG